jgi:hypothetical protein
MLMILHMRLGMAGINSTRKRLAEEKEAPELMALKPPLVVAGCKGWSTWVCPAFSSLSHSWGIYRTIHPIFTQAASWGNQLFRSGLLTGPICHIWSIPQHAKFVTGFRFCNSAFQNRQREFLT